MNPNLSKILLYFNNLNDQTRYAVLVLVVFLVILLDVLLLVSPQVAGIARLNDQIKKMSEGTQEVLVDKQRIDLLRNNLQAQRLAVGALSIRVRSTQEVPAILSTISSIANEYGISIDQLLPEKQQEEVLISSADGKYYALPVVIKAHGGYHMFGHFLNKLEGENLYFILKDFIIQNDDKDTNARLFSLTINIILVDRAVT